MQPLAEALWALLTNPNVAYLLLVVGMWSLVLAVSIPGTGFPESVAVICLVLAGVGLTQLPVNLVGLGLIGLALILFILEFRLTAHGALLLAGAIALGVGSLLLFRETNPVRASLSWVTVAFVTLVSTAFFAFILMKGLAVRKLPPAQDVNRVVGANGVTRTEVNDQGTVYVSGELWSASADDKIPAGSHVIVVARDGLRLKVARAGKVGTS